MTHVLITGASGFIGRALGARLGADGITLSGVTRTGTPLEGFDDVHAARLGGSLEPALHGRRIDAIVHAANDAGPDALATNVDGTTRWFREAADAGVGLQILLGSLSARDDAASDYGRAKYALERLFLDADQVVLRLGLVIGNGGMFRSIVDSVRGPAAPLLDGGLARVHVLGIDALCDIVARLLVSGADGLRGQAWNLQQSQSHSLRELLDAVLVAQGRRCWLVPVPSALVLALLAVVERLPLRLPVSTVNVRGLRQSGSTEFSSDYERLGGQPEPLEVLVRRAVAP